MHHVCRIHSPLNSSCRVEEAHGSVLGSTLGDGKQAPRFAFSLSYALGKGGTSYQNTLKCMCGH